MNKRTEMMIAEDRAKVCSLLARGFESNTEIAAVINENRELAYHISPAQIAYDKEYMKKKYLEKGIEDFAVYRGQILSELEELTRTYWVAYELSRRNKITIESDAVVDEEQYDILGNEGLGMQSGEKIFNRLAKTKEEQRLEGNPAFLQGVKSCIEQKAKMLGVDGTNKIALTDTTGTKNAVDVLDYLTQQIDELSEKHEEKAEPKLLNE